MNPKLAAIVTVAVIIALVVVSFSLYYQVPQSYSESQTLTLAFQNNPPWRQSICIPGTNAGSPKWTNVSFTWTTGGSGTADVVIWPSGNAPGQSVYNVTGTFGSGFYSSQGTEYFAVFNPSGSSLVVTISLSYVLPGHVWGGPITGPVC